MNFTKKLVLKFDDKEDKEFILPETIETKYMKSGIYEEIRFFHSYNPIENNESKWLKEVIENLKQPNYISIEYYIGDNVITNISFGNKIDVSYNIIDSRSEMYGLTEDVRITYN